MKITKTIKIDDVDLNKVIDIPNVSTDPINKTLTIDFELKDG